jgi:hypothetical protein
MKEYYTARVLRDDPFEIERLHSRIESEAAPVMTRLSAGERISTDEKQLMAIFAAAMFSRVPQTRDSYNFVDEQLLRIASEIAGEDSPPKGVHHTPDHSLARSVEAISQLCRLFAQMDWAIFHAPARFSFVTSDAPFVLLPPADQPPAFGSGVVTPGARKLLPLNQQTCLLMGDRGDRLIHRDSTREEIRRINLALTSKAYKYVFARDEELLKSLERATRIASSEPTPLFSVG